MIKKFYLIFVVLWALLLTGCKVLYGIVLLPVMVVDGVSNSIKAEVGEYVDANSDSTPRTIFYFDIPAEIPYEKDTGWLIKTDKGGLSEVPSRELTNEQLQISIFSDSVAERFDDAIRSLEKNKRDCDCIATDLNTGFSNECKHFLR